MVARCHYGDADAMSTVVPWSSRVQPLFIQSLDLPCTNERALATRRVRGLATKGDTREMKVRRACRNVMPWSLSMQPSPENFYRFTCLVKPCSRCGGALMGSGIIRNPAGLDRVPIKEMVTRQI